MPASDYLDQKILESIFEGSVFPVFTNVYAALFTTIPTKAGGGVEVSGFGYARETVPSTNIYWNVTGPTYQAQNVLVIDFGLAVGGAWGTVVAYALFDAAVAGNLLFFDNLTVSKAVADGDPVVFNIGDLAIVGTT